MIRMPNDSAPKLNVRVFAVSASLGTVVASGYFAVAGVLDPNALVPGGDAAPARTFAGYMAARSVVLLGALLWFTVTRNWRALALVLALNGIVQAIDIGLGLLQGSVAASVGPACFAAALVGAALWLRYGERVELPQEVRVPL